jgi:pimeloyl-ACP methyl ester carboxylesterase
MSYTAMVAPPALRPFARRITLASGELYYYDCGKASAPVLVLIHGLGDEADTWRRVFGPLSERYRVIALDLPGFGRSAQLQRPCTVAAYARVIAGLLQTLAIPHATLAGSSLGALVAQRLALAAPDLVERLVLIDGALPTRNSLPPRALWAFLTPGLGELAYVSLRRSQDEAYATLRPYYADLDGLPEVEQTFLRERVWARVWSDSQRQAFFSVLRWLAIDTATRGPAYLRALADCRVPIDLIWGEHDLIADRTLALATLAVAPNANLHDLAGCGHLPHQEQPAAVIDLISGLAG